MSVTRTDLSFKLGLSVAKSFENTEEDQNHFIFKTYFTNTIWIVTLGGHTNQEWTLTCVMPDMDSLTRAAAVKELAEWAMTYICPAPARLAAISVALIITSVVRRAVSERSSLGQTHTVKVILQHL